MPCRWRALVRGGLPVIEITLRTPGALEAIRRVNGEVEEAVVGAGTILDATLFGQAVTAGAKFIVSPGMTGGLAEVAHDSPVPLLPAAITPGEIMAARDAGFGFLKFFPAEQAGGIAFLKALSSVIADVQFCPTGGISQTNARDYLDLPNVACAGGSWVAPQAMVREERWGEIEELAKKASGLRPRNAQP